jgi:hypothetical protein
MQIIADAWASATLLTTLPAFATSLKLPSAHPRARVS